VHCRKGMSKKRCKEKYLVFRWNRLHHSKMEMHASTRKHFDAGFYQYHTDIRVSSWNAIKYTRTPVIISTLLLNYNYLTFIRMSEASFKFQEESKRDSILRKEWRSLWKYWFSSFLIFLVYSFHNMGFWISCTRILWI